MAKKEKIVDLKSKAEKVTAEELQKIQKLINTINSNYAEIGRVESHKQNILHQLSSMNSQMIKLQEELKKEYGTNDINIVDGTINYEEENGEVNKKD
tara:strand:- start:310 stop:600 length:291 start_codon:yes stop_codon:yes gene_type:complete